MQQELQGLQEFGGEQIVSLDQISHSGDEYSDHDDHSAYSADIHAQYNPREGTGGASNSYIVGRDQSPFVDSIIETDVRIL